jgi:DNA repair protein SbcC/Rad50
LALEGEKRGISQVLVTGSKLDDVEKLGLEFEVLRSRLQGLEVQKGDLERRAQEMQSRESERRALESRRQELNRRIEKSKGEIAELKQRIAEDDQLLVGREEAEGFRDRERVVAKHIAQLHREIEETQQLEASNSDVETVLRTVEADLNLKRGDLKRSRIESEELKSVPCGGHGPYAGCVKIRRAIQARQELPVMEGELSTLELELEVQRGSLATIPVSSAQLTHQLREAERERQNVEVIRKRQDEMRIAEARRAERAAALERAVLDEAALDGRLLGVDKELEQFQGLDVEINAVRRQVEEINGSLSQVRSERERLIARRAQAEQRLHQIEAARSRATILEGELSEARIERDDFDYLAKVFGPDEIQLCEIQSAGPGVSSIVNALLEGCFDNKFEVRFRTQRPKADGRGFVDDFDIEVRNKTLDRTCLVDELSGGQFVLVNEAVNLGIAIYNMRQGDGLRHETLFRDETVGALDARNAKEYIRMLRHAISLGDFHQVIFICHAQQIWELADRILQVGNGHVLVESGGSEVRPTT